MKINEIFNGIQGEGKYAGHPALFIRLSGCTRSCNFCDTKYHKQGKEINIKETIKLIQQYKENIIVWTGGEPLIQFSDIEKIIKSIDKQHHLETNGDLIQPEHIAAFSYIALSPKDLNSIQNNYEWLSKHQNIDIKVVTDLKLNKNLIPYATMLMPLTINNKNEDLKIRRKVWDYCSKHNIKYSPRLHYEIWGRKRGV